jgi:hypothetical protein
VQKAVAGGDEFGDELVQRAVADGDVLGRSEQRGRVRVQAETAMLSGRSRNNRQRWNNRDRDNRSSQADRRSTSATSRGRAGQPAWYPGRGGGPIAVGPLVSTAPVLAGHRGLAALRVRLVPQRVAPVDLVLVDGVVNGSPVAGIAIGPLQP